MGETLIYCFSSEPLLAPRMRSGSSPSVVAWSSRAVESSFTGVRERRRRLAADDRGRLVDEFVVVAEPFVDLMGDDMHDVIATSRISGWLS